MNDLLGSYAPTIKSAELYNKIIEICFSLPVKQEALQIFIVHQFRSETDESLKIIGKYDIEISEKQLSECLFRPFSAKSLKDEYGYLILKIRDYIKYTIGDSKFVSRHLDNEVKKKEFINRCFFSNIEKLIGKLDEIKQREKKNLFYLLIMKILPKMSEKQQKNLNKVMSKNSEIPEGLQNFLKKQIKLLKEQEFENIKK